MSHETRILARAFARAIINAPSLRQKAELARLVRSFETSFSNLVSVYALALASAQSYCHLARN